MKKLSLTLITALFLVACGDKANKPEETTETTQPEKKYDPYADYDPNRGIGKYSHVELGDKLDKKLADAGKSVYDVKCAGCHKLTDEKLVGPGWKGVTGRHTPHWIMNFITNTNEMLDIDPKAKAQLEICLVRMPDQNLGDDEARQLLEYMRQNDGVK